MIITIKHKGADQTVWMRRLFWAFVFFAYPEEVEAQ